jgi:hypothetical protein
MKETKAIEKKVRHIAGIGLLSLVGGTALLLAAAVVVSVLPDIKRYIKISTM